MRMKIVNMIFGMFVGMFGLTGCATLTIPVNYVPQNHIRYEGKVSVGEFQYLPALREELKQSQILVEGAMGEVYIGSNVNHFVQRATALELEKTGINIDTDNALIVTGDILELKGIVEGGPGGTVTWNYSIHYKIIHKNGMKVVYENTYKADPVVHGRQGIGIDFSTYVNVVVMSAYNKFISDKEVRKLIKTGG